MPLTDMPLDELETSGDEGGKPERPSRPEIAPLATIEPTADEAPQGAAEVGDEIDIDRDDDDDADDPSEAPSSEERYRKLRNAKRRAQAKAARLEAKYAALEAKYADVDHRLGSLTALELERAGTAANAEVSAAEQQWTEAFEAGDSKAALAAQARIDAAKQRASQVQGLRESAAQPAAPAAPTAPDARRIARMEALRDSWIDRNEWYAGADAKDRATVARISAEIEADGTDPDDLAHFKTLDRRLRQALPHRYARTASPPSAGAGRTSQAGQPSGRIRPTEAQAAVMRQFNMDPNNPAHVAQMAPYFADTRARHGGRK